MKEYNNLLVSQENAVLTLTLNRPKVNAFDLPLVEELLDALKRAERDSAIRCIVLTGAGGYFSAGQDITALDTTQGPISFRYHLERTYNRVVMSMCQLEKLIVGAINGPAAGAGLGIALATDLRLAAERARFVFGFTGIGLTADSGVSLFLPMLIGPARAMEMACTNEPLTAEQALRLGLVNRVVPDADLGPTAAEVAARLSSGPTKALGLTKRAFHHALWTNLEGVLDYEAYLQEIAGRTEDHREGVTAFLEKRFPKFNGR